MSNMKDQFSSFSKNKPQEIEDLWKQSLVTFDTNVLLRLYQYSPKARLFTLNLIKYFLDRVFITHQVGLELHTNKYNNIVNLIKSHSASIAKIKEIKKDLLSNSAFPILNDDVKQTLNSTISLVESELEKGEEVYNSLIENHDFVLEEIYGAIGNFCEQGFSEKEISEIQNEGKKRYDTGVPPGYKDIQKIDNKYGDLIIWKEILKKA